MGRRKKNAWNNLSLYIATRLAAMGLMMFDAESNLRSATAFGRMMYKIDKRHRERARNSIATAFPEWSPKQVEDVTLESFEQFLRLAIEVIHTPREVQHDTWARQITGRNLAPVLELLNARQPAILLTGHIGNWEVLGYFLAMLGYGIDAIARPIDNPYINDWLLGIRERKGMRIITKFDATERMVNVLDSGGVLGFIADQNAGDKGLFVPFFGRLASTYKSIGLLAMNKNVPVVCGYAHRIGAGFSFEMGVVDTIYPEDWENQPDPLYYITARYSRALETMIRMRPAQYLWMHRRWKSRPRHERLNKPMPNGLRKQLEDLPWMTQPELDRLMYTEKTA
ncbi:lysophospholipid acyltransferase family protein [Poriferisphaera sp. WC338]|uniref:lysophospholipid acyltransferase family protein n=1 Tax=Poriferisphaera sp. WC338 TaxID=3425129 RepID=UPI003D81C170